MPHDCELLGMGYDAWRSAQNKINGFLCLVIEWIFYLFIFFSSLVRKPVCIHLCGKFQC